MLGDRSVIQPIHNRIRKFCVPRRTRREYRNHSDTRVRRCLRSSRNQHNIDTLLVPHTRHYHNSHNAASIYFRFSFYFRRQSKIESLLLQIRNSNPQEQIRSRIRKSRAQRTCRCYKSSRRARIRQLLRFDNHRNIYRDPAPCMCHCHIQRYKSAHI